MGMVSGFSPAITRNAMDAVFSATIEDARTRPPTTPCPIDCSATL